MKAKICWQYTCISVCSLVTVAEQAGLRVTWPANIKSADQLKLVDCILCKFSKYAKYTV